MPIFAVFEVSNPDRIRDKLNLFHRDRFLEVSPNTFLVVSELISTQQMGDRLGLSEPDNKVRAIIVPITSYWGFYDRSVWEWIAAKQLEDSFRV